MSSVNDPGHVNEHVFLENECNRPLPTFEVTPGRSFSAHVFPGGGDHTKVGCLPTPCCLQVVGGNAGGVAVLKAGLFFFSAGSLAAVST